MEVSAYARMYVRTYVHIVCIYVCMCVRTYVCVCMYVYICMYYAFPKKIKHILQNNFDSKLGLSCNRL